MAILLRCGTREARGAGGRPPPAQRPAPALVGICLKSRSKVGADHVITSVCWPVEQIVGRGYATIGFLTEDIATEKNTGFAQGVFKCVEPVSSRTDESWETISAWAWAASRVMDWIATEPAIDAKRVGSTSEDHWAGQRGEWWSAKLASPAWKLYGMKGLAADSFPVPGEKQQEGDVSYHLRPGKHFLAPYDWDRYMDFADKHGWRATPP